MQGPDTDAQDQPPPFTFGLQRTAGPYRWVNLRRTRYEHIFSASLSNSDIARGTRLVKGARNGSRGLFDHLVGEREQRQWHFDAERLRGVEVEIEHSCRIFRPDLPAEEFCRAGLRPSGRGGGGISRGSIVPPGAALSRPGTAAGYRAEQPPWDIEAPRAAAAPLASLRP